MRRRPSARTCHVAGTNLSTTEWKRLVQQQQLLDKRVSSTVAMLAYGTAGALPSTAAVLSRATPDSGPFAKKVKPSEWKVDGVQMSAEQRQWARSMRDSKPTPIDEERLACAVCRVLSQEIELAAAIAGRCKSKSAKTFIGKAINVACEHLEAVGQMGHTAARVAKTRPMCASSRVTLGTSSQPCAFECDVHHHVELPGWPAIVQYLLDQDEEAVSDALQDGGDAASILADASKEEGLEEWLVSGAGAASAADKPSRASAANALLLIAAARSDTLLIKLLCAVGVCSRALKERPDADGLGFALAAAASRVDDADRPALAARVKSTLAQLHWGRTVKESGVTPIHLSAFLLEEEALMVLLHASPLLASIRDAAQRTPLHYVAHGSDRLHALVYLFSPQNFQTWLSRRSTSHLNFAPPLPLANLTAELEDAQLATIDILLANNADADARDARSMTPLALAAAAGAPTRVLSGCSARWPTG